MRCRMDVVVDTIEPMVPKLIRHGIYTIDTFNEKYGI